MSEKSFEFEFSAEKGRLEKAFNSVFASSKFSQKNPIVAVTQEGLEGYDASVRAIIPYVRCNPTFFTGEIAGSGYFNLTSSFLEKLSKGFSAGTVTITGKAVLTRESERSVVVNGEVKIIGEGAEYTEPISLPEFPDSIIQAGTQLDWFPKFAANIDRDDKHAVVKLKIPLLASGIMAIQDIAALPPSKEMTMSFGTEEVVVSIKDTGRYSRSLPIDYLQSPADGTQFVANNKYFKRAVENAEGNVLVSVYANDKDSAIIFSQLTEDLEYIFMVSGK